MQKAAILSLASVAILSSSIISCATKSDTTLQLASGQLASEHATESAMLFAKANQLKQSGKTRKAIGAFKKVADFHPLSKEAPTARFQQAELLQKSGNLIKAFDAYQDFITRYRGTNLYNTALKRQEDVAHAAASGKIKNNFIGLKSNVPRERAEKMLQQVRDNAPHATSAPKAQFAIGHMWENQKNLKKAIPAYDEVQVTYPSSSYAPKALYKVGSLLLEQSEKGNKNAGNLDVARRNFNDIIQLYPSSKEAASARKMIRKINSSDIQRSFDNAEFYQKKGQNKAAQFYYTEVVRSTKPGSTLHNQAKQRIAELSR